MKKSLLTVVLALVMTVGACFTAFGADGVSADEQKILTRLQAGITLSNGTTVQLAASDIAKAENYLASNELTADQVTETLAKVEDAQAVIKANTSVTDLAALKAAAKEDAAFAADLTSAIKAAAKAAGTEVAVDLVNGTVSIAGEEAEDTPVKQTGFNFTVTVAAAAAVVAVLGGCVVVARKNELFS
ncbi:MAG: hypothetical protein Q4F11_09475 [Eubacteriales bacterium]|nr:hypothetical protein [Eubacteriales bacterium]